MSTTDWSSRHCVPCEGGVSPLDNGTVTQHLIDLPEWETTDGKSIHRRFKFKNFDQLMAFINALAEISNQENHHADVNFSYNTCTVSYHTHAIGGLSDNDFICAAKVNKLLD